MQSSIRNNSIARSLVLKPEPFNAQSLFVFSSCKWVPDFSVSYSFTLESLEMFCIIFRFFFVIFFFNLIVRSSSLSANGRIEIQIGIENGMCSSGKSGRHPICSPTNVMDIFTRMSLSKFCTYSLFLWCYYSVLFLDRQYFFSFLFFLYNWLFSFRSVDVSFRSILQ